MGRRVDRQTDGQFDHRLLHVTSTFELRTWVLFSTRLHAQKIYAKLLQNPQMHDQVTAQIEFICLILTFDLYV